jgi:hypothetical protein
MSRGEVTVQYQPEVHTYDDFTILLNGQLIIDADRVLRGQGADPVVIRQRRPRLVEVAQRAVDEGSALIEPAAIYRTVAVEAVRHERLNLVGGGRLSGALIAQQLAAAEQVVLIAATIGHQLEQHVAERMPIDPAYALALDGFGSVAAEALGAAVCTFIEEQAARNNQCTSMPLNPGLIGWPVDVGQPEIFQQIDGGLIGLGLNDSAQMIPRKSVSMVLGLSRSRFTTGRTCDFCALRETCHYQDRNVYSPNISD